MSRLAESADAFRRAPLAHDSAAERRLLDSYAQVWAAIRASLDALLRDMAERQAAGLDVSPAWLYRQERYQTLLVQVEQQVGGLARSLNGAIQGQAAYAAMLGGEHAAELIGVSLGAAAARGGISLAFAQRLPRDAISRLVGGLTGGSPLSDLLETLGTGAAASIRKALIVGVATGQNPRVIARLVRDQAGITLTRALTISRTTVLDAYRSASLDTYQANSDVVQGWVWLGAKDARECAFCWSQENSFHTLDEPFSSHPQCRCAPAARTKSYAELGIDAPDRRQPLRSSDDLFADLSETQQRRILGPGAYSLYADGDIALADMASFGYSKDWGRYGYVTPLYRLKRRAAA